MRTTADGAEFMRELAGIVREHVDAAFKVFKARIDALEAREMPRGEKGDPGERGPEGPAVKGDKGERGDDGRDGMPGRDGLPGLVGEKGLDGKDGKDGTNGKDGLGFDDLTLTHDGERCFIFSLQRGDKVKEFRFFVPIIIDRGVWREGHFQRGDAVSFGGSLFIAQGDTDTKPETSPDWRLAVKRGREGKTGEPGRPGKDGEPGKPGHDGRKWG